VGRLIGKGSKETSNQPLWNAVVLYRKKEGAFFRKSQAINQSSL